MKAPSIPVTVAVAALLVGACDSATGPDTRLAGPANLAAIATTATSVRVIFSPVEGATAYRIDRALPGQLVAELVTTSNFYHDDVGLTPGGFYEYTVTPLRGSEVGPTSGWARVSTPEAGSLRSVLVGPIPTDRVLTADSQYVIHRVAKVMRGATLTIQPGTRIVGDTLSPQALLLVGRGARILAEGTADNPIVFTSQRPFGERNPGDWGGISIVGNARTNLSGEASVNAPPEYREPYSGGNDDDDNSGVLRYVRIEFAGHADEAGRDQNALTLLAVGRGTTIEHVQVIGALNDAFKWFGGTVDGRYLVSYEVGDDHFDVSQGYRGRNQFILALRTRRFDPAGQSPNRRTFEIDGCEPDFPACSADRRPRSLPIFANFTVVDTRPRDFSQGWSAGAQFRDGTGGILVNGAMVNLLNHAISILDAESNQMRQLDSLALWNLFLANLENFAPAPDFADRANWAGRNLEESSATFSQLFVGMPASPALEGDPRINWRPSPGSALASGGLTTFGDPLATLAGTFIVPTTYRGAADPAGRDWWASWTVYYMR
ncbi:MAG: hypothetical protein ABR499_07795 [Gemmatimonadaceae bacterium]